MSSALTQREQRRHAIERMVAHRLFHRMAARQGIDFTGGWWHGLEEKVFEALRKCELCASKKACRDWLTSDGLPASYVTFCRNAGLMETCRILGCDTVPLGAERLDAPCPEPDLSELLAEPIVQLVMASDRVNTARADDKGVESSVPQPSLRAKRSNLCRRVPSRWIASSLRSSQ